MTILLSDARGFYMEYFDRGSAVNSMDAGFSYAGQMLAALGRHGESKDAWNVAMMDGSARMMRFAEVPGTPSMYYSGGGRLTPAQLLAKPDVDPTTKVFWVGQGR